MSRVEAAAALAGNMKATATGACWNPFSTVHTGAKSLRTHWSPAVSGFGGFSGASAVPVTDDAAIPGVSNAASGETVLTASPVVDGELSPGACPNPAGGTSGGAFSAPAFGVATVAGVSFRGADPLDADSPCAPAAAGTISASVQRRRQQSASDRGRAQKAKCAEQTAMAAAAAAAAVEDGLLHAARARAVAEVESAAVVSDPPAHVKRRYRPAIGRGCAERAARAAVGSASSCVTASASGDMAVANVPTAAAGACWDHGGGLR